MATSVIGSGPVQYTTSQGMQVIIPLSNLQFDANGAVQAVPGSALASFSDAAIRTAILAWAHHLYRSGQLQQGTTSAPKPALTISSTNPGDLGNRVQVSLTNVVPDPDDVQQSTFDVEISAEETHAGLTTEPDDSPRLITAVLGVDATPGALTGLATIKGPSPVTLQMPKAGNYTDTVAAGDKAEIAIPNADESGTAFTLVSRWRSGSLKATVSGVTATTFDLLLRWERTSTGITPATVNTANGDEVQFTVPADAGTPLAGTVQLRGGAAATNALPANATVFSQE